MLQTSLPVTTYHCIENRPAEIPTSLKQLEQIQIDSNQSKFTIKSAGSQKATSFEMPVKSRDESQDTSKITRRLNTIWEIPEHLKYLKLLEDIQTDQSPDN